MPTPIRLLAGASEKKTYLQRHPYHTGEPTAPVLPGFIHACSCDSGKSLHSLNFSQHRRKAGFHQAKGYPLAINPHTVERRLSRTSVLDQAYHRDLQEIAGSKERQTVRAFGENLSTHLIHSPDQMSARLRTAPLRIRLRVSEPNSSGGAGQRMEHSPQVTTSPCGSHLSGIPYMVRRRDATANCTCDSTWSGKLAKTMYRMSRYRLRSTNGTSLFLSFCPTGGHAKTRECQ